MTSTLSPATSCAGELDLVKRFAGEIVGRDDPVLAAGLAVEADQPGRAGLAAPHAEEVPAHARLHSHDACVLLAHDGQDDVVGDGEGELVGAGDPEPPESVKAPSWSGPWL